MDGQDKILSLWAFIVVDDDGTEGVPAVKLGDTALPLMGADLARIKSLRPIARQVARDMGKPVSLVHFSTRTVQEVIEP